MARLWTGGFEIEGVAGGPDAVGINGSVTRDTSVFRSGVASAKCDSSGGAEANIRIQVVSAAAFNGTVFSASSTRFVRCYMRFDAAPSSTVRVMDLASGTRNGTNGVSARITSGGKLQLFNNNAGTQIGSDSAATIAMDGSAWYRVEMKVILNGSSQVTDVELQLDGTSVASSSGLTLTGGASGWFGWLSSPGASKVVYLDDFAINDASGSNASFPGAGNVVLMKPISDNSRGNWTAGAGGTTNLFDAVDNLPPVGVADASATNTSQIKIKSTSLPSNCDLNLDTYTNAGVSGTVNALELIENDGEDPATGTKAGTAEVVSNPASGTVSFNFANDVGTQGNYTTNWRWHALNVDLPSVTLGTAPVIRITCTSGSTGTRAASCDFLGLYVDYTPAAASGSLMLPNQSRRTIRRPLTPR